MTDELQVDELNGRELDAAMAERVLGWTEVKTTDEGLLVGHDPRERRANVRTVIPRYSTDIAAAWEVVERMREQGWHYYLDDHEDTHKAVFCKLDNVRNLIGPIHNVQAETAPLAICRAALSALRAPGSKCADCGGRLVIDDTRNYVYCETCLRAPGGGEA